MESPTYQMVPYTDLKLAEGPLPDGHLVASIRQWGLFEDVLVRPYYKSFKVIAGRRRCLALKRIAEEDGVELAELLVPCKVIDDIEAALAASVVTNNLGRKNPIADLDAIVSTTERLIKKGMTQDQITKHISKELRLSAGTQKKRLRLRALPPEIRLAICEGNCAVSTAEAIAGLQPEQLDEVMRRLAENEKITGRDLIEVRQTGIVRTVEALHLFARIDQMPQGPPAAAKVPHD
jgi:ParB-like chromosome segregation protein Spo0J